MDGENSSLFVLRLIPHPTTTWLIPPSSMFTIPSVNIPTAFLSWIYTSFTHLMDVSIPVRRSITSDIAQAAEMVRREGEAISSPERTKEKYTPPRGDSKLLPSLPLPPLCFDVHTKNGGLMPSPAMRLASIFVDTVSGK